MGDKNSAAYAYSLTGKILEVKTESTEQPMKNTSKLQRLFLSWENLWRYNIERLRFVECSIKGNINLKACEPLLKELLGAFEDLGDNELTADGLKTSAKLQLALGNVPNKALKISSPMIRCSAFF